MAWSGRTGSGVGGAGAAPADAAVRGRERRYWLIKSEPTSFSFDDLAASPGATTCWDGVRNHQARNYMRDGMRVGDMVLFYHSSTDPVGVAGIAQVARDAYPDTTAFDPADANHDPRSRADDPTWVMVDVRALERFPRLVTLDALRAEPALAKMELLRRGSRLSVQPVTPAEFERVREMGRVGA